MKKPRCVIYDLDGTVADSSVRAARTIDIEAKRRGDFETFRASFAGYSASCDGDVPIPTGIKIVHGLALAYDAVPIGLTSRGEDGRIPTLEWLIKHLPWRVSDDLLYMRPEPNADPTGWLCYAPPEEYKLHVLEHLIFERFRVCAAVDDHLGVCNMYQANGVAAVHVLYPNIDCLTPAGDHIEMPAH